MAKSPQNLDSDLQWHLIGGVEELKQKVCRKVYMQGGQGLALFYVAPDKFFLTNSTCPHARGPLEQGDIEDIGGSFKVVCPLHYYSFDLVTGQSATGLTLRTYKTEVREDGLYGLTPFPVSLTR
ncbi:Rieske domain-containing protein [Aplysia californica]|uniref:Rieske domain-containing protein n=1 Tax=Aplysia californica TaxID=6500 RepID=A0ABM0JZ63_APLCA|nr:Rieske domain-containing protein [Aplysia californica]